MTAAIPAEFTGGWVRNGIGFDGETPAEDTVVWWLQSPSRHADLRVPFVGSSGLMSFAGTTTWAEERLTWHRELDLEPTGEVDTGRATWDGADLLEAGSFRDGTRTVEYVERWQRLPGSDGELLALTRDGGRIIRTGSYALTIIDDRPSGGAFSAVAWMLSHGSWTIHHTLPGTVAAPAPPLAIAAGQTSMVLADDREWTVQEHRDFPASLAG